MAGIIAGQRKDGTKGYTARVRLRHGRTVLGMASVLVITSRDFM
jgi:hypothetical protein